MSPIPPLQQPAKLPGALDEEPDVDSLFKDLEFGMPAMDFAQQQKQMEKSLLDSKKDKEAEALPTSQYLQPLNLPYQHSGLRYL